MDIINKYWNAYKFTYMGDWKLKILGNEIGYGDTFVVHKREVAKVLNLLPETEMDNFIYEKVIHSTYGRKNVSRAESLNII